MENPWMGEDYTLELIREELGWVEFALEDPNMTSEDLASCNKSIALMREAITQKLWALPSQASRFEDYEDMIYNKGNY